MEYVQCTSHASTRVDAHKHGVTHVVDEWKYICRRTHCSTITSLPGPTMNARPETI